jgi:signal transduction histidine kinase
LQAAERGTQLTHRLLAFARQQPLDPKPTELVALFRGLDVLLNRTLGENIELKFHADEGLWPALVDASQLDHVILNLVINARDAMPGGGTITIGLGNVTITRETADELEVAAGDYVRIQVTDTGLGMDPDTTVKVFEPFFTTKEPGQGSGLGLSMAHGFVVQSKGAIRIDSTPGGGTTITIYLPRARAESAVN